MPPFCRIRHRPPPPPRSRVSRRLACWTKCSFKTIANNIKNMSSVTLYSIIINIISIKMTTTTIHDKGSTKCSEGKNILILKSAGKRRLKRRALCKEGYHWSRGISRDYGERETVWSFTCQNIYKCPWQLTNVAFSWFLFMVVSSWIVSMLQKLPSYVTHLFTLEHTYNLGYGTNLCRQIRTRISLLVLLHEMIWMVFMSLVALFF